MMTQPAPNAPVPSYNLTSSARKWGVASGSTHATSVIFEERQISWLWQKWLFQSGWIGIDNSMQLTGWSGNLSYYHINQLKRNDTYIPVEWCYCGNGQASLQRRLNLCQESAGGFVQPLWGRDNSVGHVVGRLSCEIGRRVACRATNRAAGAVNRGLSRGHNAARWWTAGRDWSCRPPGVKTREGSDSRPWPRPLADPPPVQSVPSTPPLIVADQRHCPQVGIARTMWLLSAGHVHSPH